MFNRVIKMGLLCAITAAIASAHCDSLDGPVVKAARAALESGRVSGVLMWVRPADEAAIRQAFEKTLAVRELNPEAKSLADTWFFETVVRLHRAGEGAPYDGLKPAGSVPPAILDADRAIESRNPDALIKRTTGAIQEGLRARFNRVIELSKHASEDINAGRDYVAAYVSFIHFAERVQAVASASSPQQPSGEAAHEH